MLLMPYGITKIPTKPWSDSAPSWTPPPDADRVPVDSEGIDGVARHNGIGDSAIRPFIQVQRLDGDKAGVDCIRALVQHHLIMRLLEHRSIIILIHDSHVYMGGGLEVRA